MRLRALAAGTVVATALLFGAGPATAWQQIVARDDHATVDPGQSVVIDVLANDSTGPGHRPTKPVTDPLVVRAPLYGSLTLLADQTFRYTQDVPTSATADSYRYRICIVGTTKCAEAEVTIVFNAVVPTTTTVVVTTTTAAPTTTTAAASTTTVAATSSTDVPVTDQGVPGTGPSDSSSSAAQLPRTGSASGWLTVLGAMALAFGIAGVRLGRRRAVRVN